MIHNLRRIGAAGQRRASSVARPARVVTTRAQKSPQCGRVQVYVTKVPLVGLENLTGMLGPLYPPDLKHSMTLLKSPTGECRVYDFLPKNPESPVTAAGMLLGGTMPGELRSRSLRAVPSSNTWLVADAVHEDAFSLAEDFNRSFESGIRIGSNDCRTHTNLLVEHLTGMPNALDQLE